MLQNAIFPSYFHGKCQVDGVDPPGCPNPDCPVVCGTPGSLVHFYPKLRSIVFLCLEEFLRKLASPGSDSYRQVERALLLSAGSPTKNQQISLTKQIRNALGKCPTFLNQACGGPKLSRCSWEAEMKEFILSFP